jgi:phospholipase D1/2
MGKALHFTHRPKDDRHSTTVASISRRRTRSSSVSSSDSSSSGEDNQRTETRIDPSTNMDPLHEADGEGHMAHQPSNPEELAQAEASQKNKKKKRKDVSKHTFYISNSQTRLKLYAKNEVGFFEFLFVLTFFSLRLILICCIL